MAKRLSKEAFAIMAYCEDCKKVYGITVDKVQRNAYKFVWAFPIDKKKAAREGYDSKTVRGSIDFDEDYPGCPYCGAMNFWQCSDCGAINCYKGEDRRVCQKCGSIAEGFTVSDDFEIKGGGY